MSLALVLLALGSTIRATEDPSVRAVRLGETFTTPHLGDRILMVGALVLAATPAIQIVTLMVSWWRIGDRRYAAVAGGVLLVLGLGLLLGTAG